MKNLPFPEIILASTSPYRQEILRRAGISFRAIAPQCDEEVLKNPSLNATQLTLKLAEAKALSLKKDYPHHVIIGSDQVLTYGSQIFGKPKSKENALAQLKMLNGKTHQLVTSVFIYGGRFEKNFQHTDITELTMHELTESELSASIERDLPLDCAGSYKIECSGIQLFAKINTQDAQSIQGLPLMAVLGALRDWGYQIPAPAQLASSQRNQLLDLALAAQRHAHAPYSHKFLGSAVLWEDGQMTSGCNIENASYGATVCAERVAIWKGISEKQNRRIKEILVLSDANPPWPPCGMCRQVISEFAHPELLVHMTNGQDQWIEIPWRELFPMGFEPQHLT